MPELKHNFLKGRMNKDLDERLVPNGEYRDALNVEVSTSEDSNVGAVQTVMGNTKLSFLPIMDTTKCVGKILDEKNDKLYWLVSEAGNRPPTLQAPAGFATPQGQYVSGFAAPQGTTYGVASVYGDFSVTDLIVEFDSITKTAMPIVVDTFYTACSLEGYNPGQGNGDWISVSSTNWSGGMPYVIYPGMEIDCLDQNGVAVFPEGTVVIEVNQDQWQIQLSNKPIALLDPPETYQLKFENFDRALNFQNEQLSTSSVITGINIIDDFLFWTDNQSEPKKINIKKCKREREINPYVSNAITDFQSQSVLVITDTTAVTPNAYELKVGRGNPWSLTALMPLREEHITVIKKPPLKVLTLEMRNSPREGNIAGPLSYVNPSGACIDNGGGCNGMSFFHNGVNTQTITSPITAPNQFNPFWDTSSAKVKDSVWINFGGPNSKINQQPLQSQYGWAANVPLYEIGDTIVITVNSTDPNEEVIRAKVTGRDRLIGGYGLDILSYTPTISAGDYEFNVSLEQPDPLFEFKFPRFSYRYKYEDGEYSAFAPFSEIAFLPEKFEYLPKKGYNLGMTNNLRKLVIKDFVDNKLLPPDVISIDILYKESGSPNIYTVKTITRDDFEWDAISIDTKASDVVNGVSTGRYIGTRGYLNIESEIIHAVLPANQLLRPWDNVPRKALAQEITKNRLVYGNYLQNYNMRDSSNTPINIKLELISISRVVGEDFVGSFHYSPEQRDEKNAYRYDPAKSIKTLRTYQLGVVYRDKYGRETPVFSTNLKGASDETGKASLYLEKTLANQQNKLTAQIKNNPPAWAESFKFFIKETSNEYYNLAMDRWYDAADENVWLSFPSSERNKVDIDTFLILKKGKDTSEAVLDPARYKILAIENEAPLFIKTREQNFGRLSDGTVDSTSTTPKIKNTFRTDDASENTGFPVENASYMYVHADKFGSDLTGGETGLGWHKSLLQAGKGNLYMRMRTSNVTSNWYRITSISLEPGVSTDGSLGMYRIDIEEGVFGADMNITCSDPNNINDDTISAGLSLEIKQNIEEHRPEFEGRFFVKIYKDQLIVDKIIKPSLEAVEYSVQEARAIGYINDNDGANRTVAPHDSSTTFVSEGMSPSTWAADNGWTGTWQTIQVGAFTYPILVGVSGLADGTALINIKKEDEPQSRDFWGNHGGWFVDQCSGFRGAKGWNTYSGGPGGHGQKVIDHEDTGNGDVVKNHAGRGIWDNGRMMHLSYTKVGKSGHDHAPYERSIFEESKYANEVSFITKLTAQGTLFRWKEDPDQHVYVTEATWQSSGGFDDNMAFGEHLFNFHNWCCGTNAHPVISRHNVDYAMRNRFRVRAKRLLDGAPMGDEGGYDARYLPVNDPSVQSWFDSNGINLAEKGTCSDTSFDNDEQGCTDAGGTFTRHTDNFKDVGFPTTRAPGIRQDFHGPVEPNMGTTKSGGSNPSSFISQPGRVTLQILEPIVRGQSLENASTNPAVWETEPKEDIGLDIYHEVGQIYPIEINNKTNEQFAPVGSTVGCWRPGTGAITLGGGALGLGGFWTPPIRVRSWDDNIVTLEDDTGALFNGNMNPLFANEHARPNDMLTFTRPDGSKTEAQLQYYGFLGNVHSTIPYEYTMFRDVHKTVKVLPWFNCYSFGNGVESDRIRDDYNQVTIDNGPKASTTLEEPYLEERRGSGLIYSGIYNSISGINNLNQFVQAEKITKDLNPVYGSIQKLHTRDTNLVTLCEDKCLKILANKDALFNADGNTNITATSNVLGQTIPFAGEFGISKNPESFTSESFRAYFTDKQRGVVLRLSQDGLTPISEVGMKDWFADNLPLASYLVGSYDDKKSTYNLTLISNDSTTISFSEKAKGWTSFKSFIPESGESLNNNYYTFKEGNIWRHHDDSVDRNSFYNTDVIGEKNYNSSVTVLFNDDPGTVKGFQTLNYEGTQARITTNLLDPEYYNNQTIANTSGLGLNAWNGINYINSLSNFGWYVGNMKTNLQETEELEFKGKEEKWFSQIKGVTTELSNVDTREFSVQGIGNVATVSTPSVLGCTDGPTSGLMTIDGCGEGCTGALNYNPTATIDDGSCTYCVYGCITGSLTYPQINSNYNSNATCDDGSCEPCVYGCMTAGQSNYVPSASCDDGSCIQCTYGCTDSLAINYNSSATCDDGSCTYCVYGCTEQEACNYDSSATCNDGSCQKPDGCTDPTALNYISSALCDDGSCTYCVYGCMDGGTMDQAWWDDPSSNTTGIAYSAMGNNPAEYPGITYGVTSVQTCSGWDENATCDDGSCVYNLGCTDPVGGGYNATACLDDGSCTYCCDDEQAENYDNNCSTPCADITIGDYNQMWINGGELIWDPAVTYNGYSTSIPAGPGNNWWRPTLFVKHNGVIYFARHSSASIPLGIPLGEEPGNPTLPIYAPQTQYPYWQVASTTYYNGAVSFNGCCRFTGCPEPSQTNYNPYTNYAPQGTCAPIVYGCTDDAAANYYSPAEVDNGTCVYYS
jgi:rRNA processing protein Gar1